MTIAVTHPFATGTSSSVTSIATSTVTPVNGTNLLVMGIASSVALSTVTDSRSNTYTILNWGNVTGLFVYFAYTNLATPLNGAQTVKITATLSGTGNVSQCALAASGVASTGAFDKTNNSTGTSVSPTSGNVTTTDANEVLFGFCATVTGNTITFTGGTGYTVQGTNTAGSAGRLPSNIEYQIVSATGTYAAPQTISPSAQWICGIATFSDTTISGGTNSYSLTANSGTFTMTGETSTLSRTVGGSRTLLAAPGVFSFSGSQSFADSGIIAETGPFGFFGVPAFFSGTASGPDFSVIEGIEELDPTGTNPYRLMLRWSKSPAVINYHVYQNGAPIAVVAGQSYMVTGLLQGQSYTFAVVTFSGGADNSPLSNVIPSEHGINETATHTTYPWGNSPQNGYVIKVPLFSKV